MRLPLHPPSSPHPHQTLFTSCGPPVTHTSVWFAYLMKRYTGWGLEGSGAPVSIELGCTTLPAPGCVHWPRSSQNPFIYLEFFRRFRYWCNHLAIGVQSNLQPSSPPWGSGMEWKFQPSNPRVGLLGCKPLSSKSHLTSISSGRVERSLL